MGDLLAKGSAWLAGQRHRHLSRSVIYRRGLDDVRLQATVGRTEFEQADESGFVHRIEARDYLIRAGDLVLAGAPQRPAIGDVIEECGDDGVTCSYEVLSFAGEPAWRWSDDRRQVMRVHTKAVDEAEG